MTKIDAINRMLRYIGELPIPNDITVDELPEGHEAVQARVILDETIREEQEENWWFNKFNITYTPSTNGYITLPENVVSIQSTSTNTKYLKNGNDLYDVTNQTKIFTDPVELIVRIEIGFDDLPDVFRTYVVLQAAKHLHTYLNGDETTQRELETKLAMQRVKVDREHLRQSKYNLIRGGRLIDRGSNPTPLS